jgi:hypothetical protein
VGTAAHALLAALEAVGQPPSGSFLRAA